jgi:peptidyl-tRNA hydrolase, PTH1 family
MYFIVGLGNPGQKYEKTRHNIGYMVVDYLAEENRISIQKKNSLYESGAGALMTSNILLVKPLTFMNRSGLAVRQLTEYFHENASQLIIIHDDLDIPFGQIRIKSSGGAGGHNGVSSILHALQTDQFLRVRVGIGRPILQEDVVTFVLSRFLKEEEVLLGEMVRKAAEAVREVIVSGPLKAMNLYNQKQS